MRSAWAVAIEGMQQRGQATGSEVSLSMHSAVSPFEIQCHYCDYVLSYEARPDFYFNAPLYARFVAYSRGIGTSTCNY